MKSKLIVCTSLIIAASLWAAPVFAKNKHVNPGNNGYEVWASDQSNSVENASGAGTDGGFIWIWDSNDIEAQVATGVAAQAIGCGANNGGKSPNNLGPCDLWDVFPSTLVEVDQRGENTGNLLSDLNGFGRLHGMLPDPQNMYVTANIFAPGGGFVGIIDTKTKAAIALFRVTGTNVGGGTNVRSVHMSLFNNDGSQIIIANLNGKVLERIDIARNGSGKIKSASFNRGASLGVGKSMLVTNSATTFTGKNAHGKNLIGDIVGEYATADFGDLTPNGDCKENACTSGPTAINGGRPNNVIICPITSASGKAYVTMGGGGLLVANTNTTPMTIVGEYGNESINGAGCGGAQIGTDIWLNAGVSASGAGATQSTFTMYVLNDNSFEMGPNGPNLPAPIEVFKDINNTATIGNTLGLELSNISGQLPGVSTRRDAHGIAATLNNGFIHNVDRIQNLVEVFSSEDYTRSTYDLTSADGQGFGIGACAAKSVNDDIALPANDPAPDLLERTPDGKYLMIAFRGPRPVSVGHSAQGSCPGVGIVELINGGASGKLIGVLRTTNMIDNSGASASGGHLYTGNEHSDVHAAAVISKK